MGKEKYFINVIIGVGIYTAIPLLVFIPFIPTPTYGKNILFIFALIINWIILAECRMRDMKEKIDKKVRRKKK